MKVALLGTFALLASSSFAASPFPNAAVDDSAQSVKGKQVAVLAGGCFWGLEAVFEHLKGVDHVVAGFAV